MIVLLCFITNIDGQTIVQKDSNSVIVQKEEFRHIVSSIAELQALSKLYQLQKKEIALKDFLSTCKDSIIIQKEDIIQKQDEYIRNANKEMSSFWNKNKFYIGTVTGVTATVLTLILIR